MNKKIIALALAIVFVATAFVACKKEVETMKIYGNEYPVYRDDEGELIYNENNEIAILVTDRQNEEVITYEGGEPQTYWLPMDTDVVGDGFVQGNNYKLKVPSGWEGNEFGKVEKKRTDGKCYIEFKYLAKVEAGKTLDDMLLTQDEPAQVEGTQGFLPQPEEALERPSSTRLEARFPYHGSGAVTRSPSPLAWRPDFPGARSTTSCSLPGFSNALSNSIPTL